MDTDTPYFKGKVFKHPAYIPVEDKVYTKEFVEYWKNGFSPLIGKDGILPVPELYSGSAIGRAHVEPEVKTNHKESATEAAWYAWSIGERDDQPTSNSFLVYCVCDERNACLLAYLDGGDVDSHELLKDDSFRKNVRARAEEFYKKTGSKAMPISGHETLFTEIWAN